MEVSLENTGGLGRRMKVQVPAARVDDEVTSRLESMTRTVRLDGFRPGKVPMRVVQQKFGHQVRAEVIQQVLNSTLQEALAQESIRPAGEPSIEPIDSPPGEPFEYVATFEVFPELTGPINYSFKVERPVVDINENDINEMLENLRKQRATWTAVDRAAKPGDQVTIDFEGSIDGGPFAGNKAESMPLVLGSNSMIPGFEEQLSGVSAGDEKSIELTFPDDYPGSEVAGKSATFRVRVHQVSEMELPELNDDFARAFGISEGGMEALRTEITGNMQRELKGLISSSLKSQVFSGLLEKNPVEVPRQLIETESLELRSRKGSAAGDTTALQAEAERRVKLGVIVSEIVKQNQIQLDPERVREVVDNIAASYEKPEEVVQWYYGNQEMLSGVQSAVIEDQAVEWIMEHGGVDISDNVMSFNDLVEQAKQSQG
ncbi:MAG: trigger factor [Gammaproteobacteria bacterium]